MSPWIKRPPACCVTGLSVGTAGAANDGCGRLATSKATIASTRRISLSFRPLRLRHTGSELHSLPMRSSGPNCRAKRHRCLLRAPVQEQGEDLAAFHEWVGQREQRLGNPALVGAKSLGGVPGIPNEELLRDIPILVHACCDQPRL